MLHMATTQQHAAARSEETKKQLAAANTCILSQSEVQDNFTGALKHREKVGGVITLLITSLKCSGGQERELKSSENRNA